MRTMYKQNSDIEITKKLPPIMVAWKYLNDIKWTFTFITIRHKYYYINSAITLYYSFYNVSRMLLYRYYNVIITVRKQKNHCCMNVIIRSFYCYNIFCQFTFYYINCIFITYCSILSGGGGLLFLVVIIEVNCKLRMFCFCSVLGSNSGHQIGSLQP